MLKNYTCHGVADKHSRKDLKVWQKSYGLCLEIYRITKKFSKEETADLLICEVRPYLPYLDLFYNLELFSGYRNEKRISSATCFKYFGNPIYDSFRYLRWNDLQITIGCHPAFII